MWSDLNRFRSGAFVALIVVIGLLSVTSGSVVAHGSVDQSSFPSPLAGGRSLLDRQAQTFIPTASNVAGVDVIFSILDVNFDTGTLGVLLRQGGGNGAVLGSASVVVTLPKFPTTSAVHIDFGSPIPVVPGQTYAIEPLDLNPGIRFLWGHGATSTYSGGSGFVSQSSSCTALPYDYGFATYFTTPQVVLTASPEGPPDLAAINQVGTSHTVTATLTQDGAPFPGEIIDFEIEAGPNAGATSSVVTNANGDADFTYTDTGFDTFNDDIIGVQWRGDAGTLIHVAKRWVAAPIAVVELTASPEGPPDPAAINVVGTAHTVTATLTQDGSPFAGQIIDFEIEAGPNVGATSSVVTDMNGEADFTYTDTGFDTFQDDIIGVQWRGDASTLIHVVKSWVADFDGDGDPDPTDPEPFGQHADPTFSQVPNAPDGVCICTPPMMNNQGGELQMPGSQIQNWFVKDDGDGDVDVTLTLSVVNPIEAGFHTIRVFDSTNSLVAGPVTLQYHSNINLPALASTSTTVSVSGAAGEVYRVELTVEGDPLNPDAPTQGPFGPPTPGVEVVARHYDLKFAGAIEAGMRSPSLRQIEAAPATWFLNVDAGEAPQIRVASVGLTAGAETATIELRDPSGTLVASASPSGGLFDELLTGASSTTAGQWSLTVSGLDHHYWVDKLSGGDRGIYATWLTFGFGAIDVDLGGFAGSVGLDIERLGPGATSTVFSGTFPSTSSLPLLAPGAYRVTVTPPAGFDVTPTSVDIFVGCKATTLVQFQLDALPVDPLPVLTVHKVVVNDDGATGTTTDFSLLVDGILESFGTPIVLSAGSHTIGELSPFGYEGTISGDCDINGGITLALGEVAVCTITNDDIAPTITLVKQVINDDGGTAAPDDFGLTIGGVSVLSGATTSVLARTPIAIDETVGSGYTFVSIAGAPSPFGHSECPAILGGTVTLHEGDEITCTIVNNDIAPTLTVHKVVINDDGGTATSTDFSLLLDGNSATFGTSIVLSAGTHTIGEIAVFGYEGTIRGDCDVNGVIVLSVGDVASCTITNDDVAPTITLVKQVINDEGGTAGPNDFSLTIGGVAVASGVATQVTARTPIAINETVGPDYTFVSITGLSVHGNVGCPAVLGGTVTLHEGDEITCIIVNDDIAAPPPPPIGDCDCTKSLGFWKHELDDNGEGKFTDDEIEAFLATVGLLSTLFQDITLPEANSILNFGNGGGDGKGNGRTGGTRSNGSKDQSARGSETGSRRRRDGDDEPDSASGSGSGGQKLDNARA